ncbi:MAG: fimbrillin family protein [Rikenellaceae bacterium]|nr:fimbrillin family protein [Rikenellaceae bacterium]
MQTKLYISFLLLLALSSCALDEQPGIDYESESGYLVLRATQAASTRTELGDGDGSAGSAQEIRWSVGDRISVWARAEGSSEYTFEAAPFQLATYNEVYSSADFRAALTPMSKGRYTYHAVYPVATTLSGTTATFTLPAMQSGAYDPALDVMTATTTGNALQAHSSGEFPVQWSEPELSFSHLFHLIRIRIPEGKNYLGLGIKRLDITFPQEVVGTVSFDVTDPENTISWSNLSNKVTVEIDPSHNFDAGEEYIWLHVKPTTLDGTICFVAYNEAGVMASEISTTVQKSLEAQRITPIALTIPESPLAPITYIDIHEVANNLGEDWQTMTLSGYSFVVPYSYSTTSTMQITPNAEDRYMVAIAADPSTMGGALLPLQYESEHCLFDDPITLPSTVVADAFNRIDKQVPYVFEEDFSGITSSFENGTVHKTSDAGEYDAIALSQYGLNDWYGARVGGAAGLNLRICSRMEMGLWVTNKNKGRVDTPVLSRLKSGANATIIVSYDYAGDRYESVGSGGFPVYSAGTSTSVVEKGDNEIENVVISGQVLAIDGPNANGTYYGNTPHHTSFNASGCANTTRVCWYLTNNRSAEFAGNGMYWLYIDNVKVQIAQ